MIRYRAVVTLWPGVLSRGSLPNPTRSLILGVPTGGGMGVGCFISLPDRTEISAGVQANALIEIFDDEESEAAMRVSAVMPIWYGKIIGEAREITRLSPSDIFPA